MPNLLEALDKTDWQTFRFDEIAQNISKRVEPGTTDLTVYVGLEHLDSGSLHIKRTGTPADVDGTKLLVYKGDVIFGRRRAYQRKAAIATFDGICSAHALVLRAKPDVIDPLLFPFFLHSDAFMHRAIDISVGGLSPTINWGNLKVEEFLLPPREQQAQLAELLWAADEVQGKYRSLLQTTQTAQKRYALDFYEDTAQDLGTLTDLAKINPRAPKELKDPDLPVSFLAMADVSEEGKVLTKHERKLGQVRKGFTYFADGDILFAKITPCMENGKGALVEDLLSGVGFGSTEFHVLRPYSEDDKWYCYYVSRMEKFRLEAEKRMVGSAGQRRVQTDFFDNFPLQLPTPEARITFGETMNSYEKQKEQLASLIGQTSSVKQALIDQIFTN